MTTSQSETTQEKINLPERERERIKQAILNSVARNTNYPPDELAKLTCDAICLIDSYKH
nr:MAG TPA: leucine rich repeat protein [Caudoviricetes sp.]